MEDVEVFVREHWPGLARSLSTFTGDPALGQDLAQEALARTVARWGRVRRMRSPGGFAYRVGVNLARDELRRRGRPQPAMGETVHDDGDATVRLAVAEAVASLPERQRLAVSLRYLADLSVVQTAEVMRCRPGTVKSLCSQATRALQTSPALDWHPAAPAPAPAPASTRGDAADG
jgi:RNA polymerase sigma factor (sigma-70 family)